MSKIVDGVTSEVGKKIGGLAFIVGFVVIAVISLIAFREPIGEIFKATDNIASNTEFVGKQGKINRMAESRLVSLEAKVDGIIKFTGDIEQIDRRLDRLITDFEFVKKIAEKSESNSESVKQKFSDIEQKNLKLEKDLSSFEGALKQAQKEIEKNNQFTSEQPKRAATRIEQLRVLYEYMERDREKVEELKREITYIKAKHGY